MNKGLFFVTLMLFSQGVSQKYLAAQTIHTSVSQLMKCPQDTGLVSVDVTGFVSVASISLTLSFNPSRLEYVDYLNPHPSLSSGLFFVNNTGANIKLAWFSITPLSFDIGTLVQLRFIHLVGHGFLSWDTLTPGACQYSNASGVLLPAVFYDGYISAPGSVVQSPLNDTVTPGDTAIFEVYTLGTTLTYRWQENAGAGWVDIFNGFYYSGASTAQLKVLKPSLLFNGHQYRCRTTGPCPAPGNTDFSSPAVLKVQPPCQNAHANAGTDTSICAGDSVSLHGIASHYQYFNWSGGDGYFSPSNSLQTTYFPGSNDLLSGFASIVLHAFAYPPCSGASDSLVLDIQTCTVNQPPFFSLNLSPIDTLAVDIIYATHSPLCIELTDPENDTVFLNTVIQYPGHGTISNFFDGDTCFFYAPNLFFIGADQIIITGCDLHGACDTLVLDINVTLPAYNLPPVAVAGGNIVDTSLALLPMNTGGLICVDAFDPEGDPCDLTQIVIFPNNGSIQGLANGDSCIVFTPDSLFLGKDTFTIALCDTPGACTSITFIVEIADFQFPAPPIAMPDSFSLLEGGSVWCTVLLNDFDINGNIDTSSLEVISLPQFGTTLTTAGLIAYTPIPYYHGLDFFQYRICDDSGYCDTALVKIRILPYFDAPQDDSFVTNEDHPLVCYVLDNDQYPYQVVDTSSLSILTAPVHGSAAIQYTTGTILYTPNTNFYGSDSFQYRICDTMQMCGNAMVRLTITPINDPPGLVSVNGVPVLPGLPFILDACQNTPLMVCLGIDDPDGDIAYVDTVWSLNTGATAIVFSAGDTCYHYSPPPGYSGLDTIFSVLSDGLEKDTVWITIRINELPFVFAGSDTMICSGDIYFTSNAVVIGATATHWQTTGTGVFFSPTALQTFYIPSMQDLSTGQVRLILSGLGYPLCGASNDTLNLTFRPLPDIWLGKDTTLCENNTLTLDGGSNFLSWIWSTGHNSRFLTVDTMLIGMGASNISITVTDGFGCNNEDQISITFIHCPGIYEAVIETEVRLSPNPSNGSIYIHLSRPWSVKPDIRISNIQGSIILPDVSWISHSLGMINTEMLPQGMYFLILSGPSGRISRKFIRL